jgi:hypothetical protein
MVMKGVVTVIISQEEKRSWLSNARAAMPVVIRKGRWDLGSKEI